MSVNYPTAGYSWEYWYRPLSSNMDLYCSQQFNIFVMDKAFCNLKVTFIVLVCTIFWLLKVHIKSV